VSLRNLNVAYNQIADVSPLAHLHGLKLLSLKGNQVTAIRCLTSLDLETLDLGENAIEDLECLPLFPNLADLWLAKLGITNVEVLGQCSRLKSLGLESNRVSDVSALAKAPTLRFLDVLDNNLTSVESFACLTQLEHLNLSNNR